jgi:hypothetical protein
MSALLDRIREGIKKADADVMHPVDIQGQYVILAVTQTEDMLATQASAVILAGGSGNVELTVPSGELWEITVTNHAGSGADISLNYIEVSPDGGTTYYQVKTSHISGEPVWVSAGNIIRANYSNAGAVDETAYLTVIGRKLKVSV